MRIRDDIFGQAVASAAPFLHGRISRARANHRRRHFQTHHHRRPVNRTPDNIFGAGPSTIGPCGSEDPFEPGIDIQNGGYGYLNGTRQLICNGPLPLSGYDAALGQGVDPDHTYLGWGSDFHAGMMDGFCHGISGSICPPNSYVQKSDVQPYFDIATNYGFANYMFQTNEGPSFPAHQFLFTGTSAPVAPNDPNSYYLDFVSDNQGFNDSGCSYTGTTFPKWVQPNGKPETDPRSSECYPHDSLVTDAADCSNGHNCDRGIVTWAYYETKLPTTVIWDAPSAIPEVCYGATSGTGSCGGTEWNNHIRIPHANGYSDAPIFDDLFNCNLPQVSWVIPDGAWSDHPQLNATSTTIAYGPSWVGDIVDAVGGGMTGSTCNPPSTSNAKYWKQEPTLVLVVWDDWGGWFDHVAPFLALQENPHLGYNECNPSTQWGCGYTYGFRVPLLVVSPYTGAGYVSGPCQLNCPDPRFPYIHDFGSILAFTEYNFGMKNITFPQNYYADANAPDNANGNISLSDFFNLSSPRSFTSITTPEPFSCFQNFAQCKPGWVPTAPDTD